MTAPSPLRVRLSALLGLLAIILGSMGAHGKVHDMLVAANELDHALAALDKAISTIPR